MGLWRKTIHLLLVLTVGLLPLAPVSVGAAMLQAPAGMAHVAPHHPMAAHEGVVHRLPAGTHQCHTQGAPDCQKQQGCHGAACCVQGCVSPTTVMISFYSQWQTPQDTFDRHGNRVSLNDVALLPPVPPPIR